MKTINVKLTFIEEVLGTSSNNPEIHRDYIASKSEDPDKIKEEVEAIENLSTKEKVELTMTVFPRMTTDQYDDVPFFWDYQIKGMLKNAGKALNFKGSGAQLTAFKTKLDNRVFISPRRIPMKHEDLSDICGEELTECQRPLRAETPQGPRVALAHSEQAAEGTTLLFTIKILEDALEPYVRAFLDYGELNGLGQWHNSGKGRFVWEEVE